MGETMVRGSIGSADRPERDQTDDVSMAQIGFDTRMRHGLWRDATGGALAASLAKGAW